MNPLAQYLKDRQESEYAFAIRSGIPQPTVWRIANDKVIPNPENAEKIEHATKGQVNRLDLLYPD